VSEGDKLGDLEKIVAPKQPPENSPDDITKKEAEALDQAKVKLELEGIKQDQTQRKEYADRIFCLIKWWLVAILAILVLHGFAEKIGFKLSDKVLITLIGGTTINVLGIFAIVANYIFYRPSNRKSKK